MINIKPFLRTYQKSPEKGFVWVRFYIKSQKVHFSCQVECRVTDWDEKEYRVRSTDPLYKDKNTVIQNIVSRVSDVFVRYRLKNKTLTVATFHKAYNRPNDYDTFFEFVKQYLRKNSYKIEPSTFDVHQSVMKKIEEFNPDLHFDDITPDWLDEYYSHLRKTLKNNENTAYKNMSTLKKYVRLSFKAGYMEENPFDDWRIKRTRSSYTYLTEDELNLFVNYYTGGSCSEKHYKTLEFFLFMCFSSLHVTDARLLKLEQFVNDEFIYFRVKNRNSKPEPIHVPVSEALRSIIKNAVGYRTKGLIFENLPADQTMNRYLKEIAEELEIDKAVTNKTGRHTFATFFLAKTKDLASLKEILGHSELRETLIYAHVLDESKQEGIKFFDEFKL